MQNKSSDFEFHFNLLYAIPAAINIVLPFYGGFILDRYGARNCLLVYILLVAAGHTLYTIGISAKSWPMLFAGRAVFGLGDGSTSVANLTILSSWFEGKELALALGLNLSASRIGSVLNNLISPIIASQGYILGIDGVVMSSIAAIIIVTIAVVAAVLIFILDKREEEYRNGNSAAQLTCAGEYGSVEKAESTDENSERIQLADVFKFSTTYKLLVMYGLLLYGIMPFYPCGAF